MKWLIRWHLMQKQKNGLPLRNEEDKAFYEKYRYKYGIIPREQDENSFAFWESEMSETEDLKKFKGKK
jgi:hypothetical protein